MMQLSISENKTGLSVLQVPSILQVNGVLQHHLPIHNIMGHFRSKKIFLYGSLQLVEVCQLITVLHGINLISDLLHSYKSFSLSWLFINPCSLLSCYVLQHPPLHLTMRRKLINPSAETNLTVHATYCFLASTIYLKWFICFSRVTLLCLSPGIDDRLRLFSSPSRMSVKQLRGTDVSTQSIGLKRATLIADSVVNVWMRHKLKAVNNQRQD